MLRMVDAIAVSVRQLGGLHGDAILAASGRTSRACKSCSRLVACSSGAAPAMQGCFTELAGRAAIGISVRGSARMTIQAGSYWH